MSPLHSGRRCERACAPLDDAPFGAAIWQTPSRWLGVAYRVGGRRRQPTAFAADSKSATSSGKTGKPPGPKGRCGIEPQNLKNPEVNLVDLLEGSVPAPWSIGRLWFGTCLSFPRRAKHGAVLVTVRAVLDSQSGGVVDVVVLDFRARTASTRTQRGGARPRARSRPAARASHAGAGRVLSVA